MAEASRSLANQVAIVTGGASGIGRAIGEELASRGCEVVLADRQSELAGEVAKGILERGGRATAAALDVRDLVSWEALVGDTIARSGHIDYLFNNAGIGVGGEIGSYAREDWDDVIDVNLRGVAYGIQAVYPQMRKQGSGHIVNTASVAGLVATPAEGVYAATKHGVVALTKALRVEAEGHGVRASVLCPGAVRTPILRGGKFGRSNMIGLTEEMQDRFWSRARPIEPEELARRAVDAVMKNQAIIVIPSWWKVFWYIDRVSPELSMRFWKLFLARMRAELRENGVTPVR